MNKYVWNLRAHSYLRIENSKRGAADVEHFRTGFESGSQTDMLAA